MVNLIDLAGEVQELMQQYGDIGTERERMQILNTRAKSIRDIRDKYDAAIVSSSMLHETNIPVRPFAKASRALINKCEKIKEGIEKNWDKTIRDPSIKANFIDPVDDHIDKKIGKNLKEDWRSYIDAKAPKITKASLEPLASGFGDTVEKIAGLLEEISQFREVLPGNLEQIAHVQQAAKEASEAFEKLDKIPEAVRTFLAKAAKGEALLTDLSEDVKDWLIEYKMLAHLRIQFDSSA